MTPEKQFLILHIFSSCSQETQADESISVESFRKFFLTHSGIHFAEAGWVHTDGTGGDQHASSRSTGLGALLVTCASC